MSRRPGFVLDVDSSTPPTLFWNGEGFTLETLPEGSRVVYAPEPMRRSTTRTGPFDTRCCTRSATATPCRRSSAPA